MVVLLVGGAPGAIHMVMSPTQVPSHDAIILWGSEGVMYACQFRIIVAESGIAALDDVDVFVPVSEVFVLSAVVLLLHARSIKAAQIVMVIRFIKNFLQKYNSP